MSNIRLSKVVKDLNVGLTTAVEFLQKKGHGIEANPNTKISDDEYLLLVKEFSSDKNLKIESERISQQRHDKEKAASVAIEGFDIEEKAIEKKKEESEVIAVSISEEQRPQVKQVGKIDLDSLNKKPEPKKVEEKIQTTVAVPVPAEKNKPDTDLIEKTEDEEIFTLGAPAISKTPNVIGRIDLATLNQQTRPAKKTKEEKRQEREAKEKQWVENKQVAGVSKKEDKKEEDKIFKANNTKLNGPKIVGSIEVAEKAADSAISKKKKRTRIHNEKVDINKGQTPSFVATNKGGDKKTQFQQKGNKGASGFKKTVKVEVTEEDVQKQIKETLARLTEKKVKGSKYRREKRENISARQQEIAEMERMDEKVLKLTEFVTANELAVMMNVSVNQVIATCMNLGLMVSINQRLDAETINIVADEFGYKTEYVSAEVSEAISEDEDSAEDLESRAPIVTVMGHVDHGKTSLLDYIRHANVIAGEAGGITQHIGAYNVTLDDGREITFLDTPGHEAFTAMRARGAKVTDIAIIIVAADDNVMPQTVEAINHASAAGVPMVFAINKIDKPGADAEKIKETLAGMNYLVEDWGGKYQSQDVSAKKGIGVTELLEKVLLEAELLDLKANPNRRAFGSIIESSLDKGRGYVSTVLVQNGTLRVGDVVLAGTHFGKVKAMFNERNQRITQAKPAEPALILGLNGAPQAGDNFNVIATEQEAREIANKREQLQREQGLRTSRHLTLDEIGRRIALGNFQELNVIVKGDVDGSIEALSDSLIKLSTEEIQVNVIHKAVGAISESDVMLAAASNAIIVGFQVRPSMTARKLAEKEEIDIRLYSIIYDAIEEVKAAMEGMLSPDIKEEITATIEIREVFKITKVGSVAGCMVKEGKVKRGSKIRLIRDGIVIYSGELGSLKRFKEDVKEVMSGYECGLNIQNYNDIKIGDIIEAYEETEVKKTL